MMIQEEQYRQFDPEKCQNDFYDRLLSLMGGIFETLINFR